MDTWRWSEHALLPAHRQGAVAPATPRSCMRLQAPRRSRMFQGSGRAIRTAAQPAGACSIQPNEGIGPVPWRSRRQARLLEAEAQVSMDFRYADDLQGRPPDRLRDAAVRRPDRRPDAVPARRPDRGRLARGAAACSTPGPRSRRARGRIRPEARGRKGADKLLLERDESRSGTKSDEPDPSNSWSPTSTARIVRQGQVAEPQASPPRSSGLREAGVAVQPHQRAAAERHARTLAETARAWTRPDSAPSTAASIAQGRTARCSHAARLPREVAMPRVRRLMDQPWVTVWGVRRRPVVRPLDLTTTHNESEKIDRRPGPGDRRRASTTLLGRVDKMVAVSATTSRKPRRAGEEQPSRSSWATTPTPRPLADATTWTSPRPTRR